MFRSQAAAAARQRKVVRRDTSGGVAPWRHPSTDAGVAAGVASVADWRRRSRPRPPVLPVQTSYRASTLPAGSMRTYDTGYRRSAGASLLPPDHFHTHSAALL